MSLISELTSFSIFSSVPYGILPLPSGKLQFFPSNSLLNLEFKTKVQKLINLHRTDYHQLSWKNRTVKFSWQLLNLCRRFRAFFLQFWILFVFPIQFFHLFTLHIYGHNSDLILSLLSQLPTVNHKNFAHKTI